jgi:hypothetical protein
MRLFGVEYGDNAVDMQIDIGFNSSWTDAHGEDPSGSDRRPRAGPLST